MRRACLIAASLLAFAALASGCRSRNVEANLASAPNHSAPKAAESAPPSPLDAAVLFHWGSIESNDAVLHAMNAQYDPRNDDLPAARGEGVYNEAATRLVRSWGEHGSAGSGLYFSSTPGDTSVYGPDLLILERRRDPAVADLGIASIPDGEANAAWESNDIASIPALFCYTCLNSGEGWFLLARWRLPADQDSYALYRPAAPDVIRVFDFLAAKGASSTLRKMAAYFKGFVPRKSQANARARIFMDRLYFDAFYPWLMRLDLAALDAKDLELFEKHAQFFADKLPGEAKTSALLDRYWRFVAETGRTEANLASLLPSLTAVVPAADRRRLVEAIVRRSYPESAIDTIAAFATLLPRAEIDALTATLVDRFKDPGIKMNWIPTDWNDRVAAFIPKLATLTGQAPSALAAWNTQIVASAASYSPPGLPSWTGLYSGAIRELGRPAGIGITPDQALATLKRLPTMMATALPLQDEASRTRTLAFQIVRAAAAFRAVTDQAYKAQLQAALRAGLDPILDKVVAGLRDPEFYSRQMRERAKDLTNLSAELAALGPEVTAAIRAGLEALLAKLKAEHEPLQEKVVQEMIDALGF